MSVPVGLGTDLIEVDRIAAAIERHGERFLARCFTQAERLEVGRKGPKLAPERLAARFAAKEATFKALGTGWARGIAWTDVGVVSDERGAPSLTVTGRAADIAAERGIRSWLCSMTHTASLASATVIALG